MDFIDKMCSEFIVVLDIRYSQKSSSRTGNHIQLSLDFGNLCVVDVYTNGPPR